MTRMIFCKKLQKMAEGLESPPYPGKLGQEIFESISAEAWQDWINHQTMVINENRLNLLDASAREKLLVEMKKFLFEGGSEKPEGFVPVQE